MKKFTNVEGINFSITLEGKGCVNYDSVEQLEFLTKKNIVKKNDPNFFLNGKPLSNINFSKKIFKHNEDGTTEFHVVVSPEKLRYLIFEESMKLQTPAVMNIPEAFLRVIAHPDLILRGFLFTEKEGTSLRKKSVFGVSYAEEVGPWRNAIALDFHSRSGEKKLNKGKDSDDKKDTSIYKKENVGELTYLSTGYIDVKELRFIPADTSYDRCSVNVDGGENEAIYLEELKCNMVNFIPEFGYYYLENSYTQDQWPEKGILLNDESVDMLIKRLLKLILNIHCYNSTAFLKTKKLVISVKTNDGFEDFEVTHENINDISFDCVNSYRKNNNYNFSTNKDNN